MSEIISDGLFMVDLRGLQLSAEQVRELDNQLQKTAKNFLATLSDAEGLKVVEGVGPIRGLVATGD